MGSGKKNGGKKNGGKVAGNGEEPEQPTRDTVEKMLKRTHTEIDRDRPNGDDPGKGK